MNHKQDEKGQDKPIIINEIQIIGCIEFLGKNVRKYRRGNQEWAFQRNGKHWAKYIKRRQTKQKTLFRLKKKRKQK